MVRAANENDRSAAGEFKALRELLVAEEITAIEAIRKELQAVRDGAVLRDRLEQETATVLASALRRAERDNPGPLTAAVAPIVVSSIQSEIRNSKEMMVEALYPITGRLVSASVAAAVRNAMEAVDRKINALTSFDGLRLALKARLSGVPLPEMMMAEARNLKVRRILLIEKGSGILLQNWPVEADDGQVQLRSSLVAAILEFAAQSLTDGGDLQALDMGEVRIFLKSSAQAIVAIEVMGTPGKEALDAMDAILMDVVVMRNAGYTPSEAELAASAAQIEAKATPTSHRRNGRGPAWWIGAVAALAALWFAGTAALNGWRESNVVSAIQNELNGRPDLVGFALRTEFDHGGRTVRITGALPSPEATNRIVAAAASAVPTYDIRSAISLVALRAETTRLAEQIDSQRADLNASSLAMRDALARDVVENRSLTEEQIERWAKARFEIEQRLERITDSGQASEGRLLAKIAELEEAIGTRSQKLAIAIGGVRSATEDLANRADRLNHEGVARVQDVESAVRTVEGGLLAKVAELERNMAIRTQEDAKLRSAAAEQIGRLEAILLSDRARLERLTSARALAYDVAVVDVQAAEDITFLEEVARALEGNALRIEVLSIADLEGSPRQNVRLATARARMVQDILVARGVSPDRILPLVASASSGAPYSGRRVYLRPAAESAAR